MRARSGRPDESPRPSRTGRARTRAAPRDATVTVAPVREAVSDDRVKRRVAEHDLQPSVRRRVVSTHRLDVLDQCVEHRCPLKQKRLRPGSQARDGVRRRRPLPARQLRLARREATTDAVAAAHLNATGARRHAGIMIHRPPGGPRSELQSVEPHEEVRLRALLDVERVGAIRPGHGGGAPQRWRTGELGAELLCCPDLSGFHMRLDPDS
jgi:hypothetical protein